MKVTFERTWCGVRIAPRSAIQALSNLHGRVWHENGEERWGSVPFLLRAKCSPLSLFSTD